MSCNQPGFSWTRLGLFGSSISMSCDLLGKKKLNGDWRVGIWKNPSSNFKVLVYIPHKLVYLKWSPTQPLNKKLNKVVGNRLHVMLPCSSSCFIPTIECYILLLQPTTKVHFMYKSLFYYNQYTYKQSKTFVLVTIAAIFISLHIDGQKWEWYAYSHWFDITQI